MPQLALATEAQSSYGQSLDTWNILNPLIAITIVFLPLLQMIVIPNDSTGTKIWKIPSASAHEYSLNGVTYLRSRFLYNENYIYR